MRLAGGDLAIQSKFIIAECETVMRPYDAAFGQCLYLFLWYLKSAIGFERDIPWTVAFRMVREALPFKKHCNVESTSKSYIASNLLVSQS